MNRRAFLQLAAMAPVLGQPGKPSGGTPWKQWGGPHRNFQTEASGLKSQWPATGPKVIWKRPLGEGYSSPAVEDNLLFTMYGRPGDEIVLAADARTGKKLWEHVTSVSFHS